MHFYSKKHIDTLEKYLWVKSAPWIYEKRLLEKISQYNTYFRYIPWVLSIAVCNSLAMNAAHEKSDIDLFIITQKNRLWTARICMTLLLTLMWQRKTSKHHAWKFCLSFFITENKLSFEDIALKNDIYLAYWTSTLRPIINRKNTFEKFKEANKKLVSTLSPFPWLSSHLNEKETTKQKVKMQSSSLLREKRFRGKRKFSTLCWDVCEKILKFIFLPRTQKSFQKLWKPFWVIIWEDILKFHDKDKRKEIRDKIIFS